MTNRAILALLLVGTIGAIAVGCTTQERVETTPAIRDAEEQADMEGEANIVLQDTFPSWRATASPPGGVAGPNAEAILRGGRSATTIHVDLDGGEEGATYPWHIHSGDCGDASAPIVGDPAAYPPIQVGDGGEGDAEAQIATTLDSEGDYILNVHLSPAQTDSIVACGPVVASSSPEY